ncbi:MAG: adenylate/guanylate cyclase domain-containing protein [Dehalococcoidia bacterium]
MTERPTGTVTFLFTDIEGSTSRWEEQTEEMRAALARHDDALKTAIEAHDGWAFKHTGDGMLAAFSSPKSAIGAAIDAQRTLELPVRMGIATGEAELRGDDYFGPALNRAARVMSAGHGGQVLLAPSTEGLVSGVDLLDLGDHRLRDLSQPQRLYQVRAKGLREKFPALRTLDATPGNLPLQPTSFVGREGEVAEVIDQLTRHRLVTLTGVGGVGKTRLALQVAAEMLPTFSEGAWLVELAPVGDPGAVPDAVAGTLGIAQQPGLSVAQSIAEASVGRVCLLILDNCEHVLDAVANLAELTLSRSATVRILTTSREGLGVPGEQLRPVASLRTGGADSAAITLFADRARAVVPGFSLDRSADAEAVLDICQRLDGIPLAIELAAARMAHMSPGDVRARLNDRFRLLSGSRRGLERHQTLRQAVQWSYDLLDGNERALLDRCSVFAGSFDLESAVAVGGRSELDEYEILDLLAALVRKSLLTLEHAVDGHARYGMLETIRQFGEERLGLAGEGEVARSAHAAYFAAKAASMMAAWASQQQRTAHDWLDIELPNLRSALHWASVREDLDSAAAIAIPSAWIGFDIDRWEPMRWAEDLLPAARRAGHRQLPGLYIMAGRWAMAAGRDADAVGYHEAAFDLLDDARYDEPPFGVAHQWLAVVHYAAGRLEQALEQHTAEIQRTGDPLGFARANAALSLTALGRPEEARAMAGPATAAARSSGIPSALAWALACEGVATGGSDPAEALALLRRAMQLAREARAFETVVAFFLIPFESRYGDPLPALILARQLLDGFFQVGAVMQARATLASAAILLARVERFPEAAVLFGASGAGFMWPGTDDALGASRDAIGADEVTRLQAEGAAMELAGALAYARGRLAFAQEELESAG